MPPLTIALLQMASHGSDQQANLAKGDAFCRQANEMGADIALFPEMWNVGYRLPDPEDANEMERWQAQAVGPDDEFVVHFRNLAQELDMAIALTYLERWPELPRNTMALIDRRGEIVLTYAKVHTCDFDREAALTPGEDFPVVELDTAQGPVKIGAMICYDREFPESARILMLRGAEIILTPNCCEIEENRLSQYRGRAFENMVGLAMTNYAAPDSQGRSVAFDGMVCSEPLAGEIDGAMRDMTLVEAGPNEGVFLARFDLDALRAYREREAMGNTFRKPRLYGILADLEVEAPFIRSSARR